MKQTPDIKFCCWNLFFIKQTCGNIFSSLLLLCVFRFLSSMLLLSLSLSLFYLYFYFLPFFQMLGCRTRGFSFTRALLGISADELHLCGDVSSVPLIQGILKVTGDDFEVMKSSVDMHLVKLPLVLIFEGTFFLQYFPSDEILLEHGLVGILMLYLAHVHIHLLMLKGTIVQKVDNEKW